MEHSSNEYLATGFRDVDTSGDTTAYTRCLDLLSDIPFFKEIKEESFRIITGTEPEQVLDAGCGPGFFTRTIVNPIRSISLLN